MQYLELSLHDFQLIVQVTLPDHQGLEVFTEGAFGFSPEGNG